MSSSNELIEFCSPNYFQVTKGAEINKIIKS